MDSERAIEDAKSVCSDLRALFERPGGPDSLEEVERLCEILHLMTEDPRCRHAIRNVQRYARSLLTGDHRRWARGTTPGRVFLAELILSLLRVIDARLRSLWVSERARHVRSRARDSRLELEAARQSVGTSSVCT